VKRLTGRIAAQKHESVVSEIAQERAIALGRVGERLTRALDALRAHDAAAHGQTSTERESLVDAAAEALWYYVVQREACGLRDTAAVLRELGVPREVELRMGVRKR